MRCDRHATTGGRCELSSGHDGKHQGVAYPADADPRTYTWDDESGRAFIDAESRKKLGT